MPPDIFAWNLNRQWAICQMLWSQGSEGAHIKGLEVESILESAFNITALLHAEFKELFIKWPAERMIYQQQNLQYELYLKLLTYYKELKQFRLQNVNHTFYWDHSSKERKESNKTWKSESWSRCQLYQRT